MSTIKLSQDEQDFLDSYFEEVACIWWLFEQKEISRTKREEALMPYRKRLYDMHKEGKIKRTII